MLLACGKSRLLNAASCDAGEEKEILVEHDDGIRPDISTAALSKLKAVFKKDGSTTAGNSSQVCLLILFGASFDSTACGADTVHPPLCLSPPFFTPGLLTGH